MCSVYISLEINVGWYDNLAMFYHNNPSTTYTASHFLSEHETANDTVWSQKRQ
jgi:hypothetical protein